MSLFKSYFDKEKITDITYEDVLKFFVEKKEENDKIEFKSFISDERENDGEKLNGVIKSICGFLNSEGGITVWGAPIGKKVVGKKEKIFQGELSLVEKLYEKDAFISKVTDNITPNPNGILFHKIEKDGSYLYIIESPKSKYSPHQTKNIYYMRIDGQTRPAPHSYIEALFRKIRFPNLEGYMKIDSFKYHTGFYFLNLKIYFYNLSKLQNDYNLSFHLLTSNGKFAHANGYTQKGDVDTFSQGDLIDFINIKDILHYGQAIEHEITLVFDFPQIQKDDFLFNIYLNFGAKLSPMKSCSYKININPNNMHDIKNRLIVEYENHYMYEIKESMGISDKEAIELNLGRKIN